MRATGAKSLGPQAALSATFLAASLALITMGGAANAQTPKPRPGDAAGTATGERFTAPTAPADTEAARKAFEGLPPEARARIQDMLVWTGDYQGTLDGAFGRGTLAAIQAFETRAKLKADGILTDAEQATLVTAGERARNEARFRTVIDKVSGARLGVPFGRVALDREGKTGTVWKSKDGKIVLQTFSRGADVAMADVFAEMAAPSPTRKVTYQVLRDGFYVVAGEEGTNRFYLRGAPTANGVRGFVFSYDKALGPQLDRVSVAISNSFSADGAAADTPVANTTPAAPAATTRRFTGLTIAQGRVVTATAALAGCANPQVEGKPARVAEAGKALTVLDVPGLSAFVAPIVGAYPPPETELVVVYAGEPGRLVIAPGPMVGGTDGLPGRVLAALQPEAAGGAVFDRAGRLIGLVAEGPGNARQVAGLVPARAATLAPVPGTPGGGSTTRLSAGALAAAARPMIVSIGCGG